MKRTILKEELLSFFLNSERETEELARQVAHTLLPGSVFFLKGMLGAGKTTFVRGFLRGLQFEGKVKSPTFTLVEEYLFQWGTLYHFDLYRLSHADELEFIGIREYFTPSSVVFIEWPERGQGKLPAPDVEVSFSILAQGRKLQVKAGSAKGQALLSGLP